MPRTAVAAGSRPYTVKRVRSKKRQPLAWRWIILGHAAVIFFALSVCVWARLETFRASYEIARQHRARKSLLKDNQELTVEIASLKSPARLKRVAKEQLGLVHPTKEQMVWLP
jgi:cell division protein FtsL